MEVLAFGAWFSRMPRTSIIWDGNMENTGREKGISVEKTTWTKVEKITCAGDSKHLGSILIHRERAFPFEDDLSESR